MIDLVFAPKKIIIMGPKATFGIEFNIFKNGSNILYKVLNKYKSIEIIKLIMKQSVNDINISFKVIFILLNKLLDTYKFLIVLTILYGEENINELIILLSLSICHIKINNIIDNI